MQNQYGHKFNKKKEKKNDFTASTLVPSTNPFLKAAWVISSKYHSKQGTLFLKNSADTGSHTMIHKAELRPHSFFFFFVFLAISWAAPAAYVGSPGQRSNQSCSCRPTPQPQQRGIRATSATYATAHGNAGSLTHSVRPGIEPETLWFLVGFVNHWATTGTP